MSGELKNDEISSKINLYFDNALNKEEEIELMENANSNPVVEALIKEEKKFRQRLKFALGRTPASTVLVDSIKSQINNS